MLIWVFVIALGISLYLLLLYRLPYILENSDSSANDKEESSPEQKEVKQ